MNESLQFTPKTNQPNPFLFGRLWRRRTGTFHLPAITAAAPVEEGGAGVTIISYTKLVSPNRLGLNNGQTSLPQINEGRPIQYDKKANHTTRLNLPSIELERRLSREILEGSDGEQYGFGTVYLESDGENDVFADVDTMPVPETYLPRKGHVNSRRMSSVSSYSQFLPVDHDGKARYFRNKLADNLENGFVAIQSLASGKIERKADSVDMATSFVGAVVSIFGTDLAGAIVESLGSTVYEKKIMTRINRAISFLSFMEMSTYDFSCALADELIKQRSSQIYDFVQRVSENKKSTITQISTATKKLSELVYWRLFQKEPVRPTAEALISCVCQLKKYPRVFR